MLEAKLGAGMETVDFQDHRPVMLLPLATRQPLHACTQNGLCLSLPKGTILPGGAQVGPANGKSWENARGWRRKGLRSLRALVPQVITTFCWMALPTGLWESHFPPWPLSPEGSDPSSLSGPLHLVTSVSSAFSRFSVGVNMGAILFSVEC